MPLNTLPFPTSSGVPYYDNKDANNFLTMPVEQYIRNGSNLFVPVSATNPQPTSDATAQASLAAILAKIIAAPATAANQATIMSYVDGIEGALTTLNAKDFATQATLAAILAKIIAAPATEAKQTALNALIGEVQAAPTQYTTLARIKSLEDKIDAIIAGTSPAVVQVAGSNLKWTPVAIIDTSAGIAKTFTVPSGKEYEILSIFVTYTSTAKVGNRILIVTTRNTAGAELLSSSAAGVPITANQTRRITFAPNLPKETAVDLTYLRFTVPLPHILLPATYTIKVEEWNGVDYSDTMQVNILVRQRAVA